MAFNGLITLGHIPATTQNAKQDGIEIEHSNNGIPFYQLLPLK